MAETTKEIRAFTSRIPEVLYIAAQAEVAKRKAGGDRKFSMQDLLLEGLRGRLYPESGPEQRNPVQISAPKISEKPESENIKSEVAAIRAKLGMKTLATIEEVEPALNPESGYIPPPKAELIVQQEHMPSRNWQKFNAAMEEMEPTEAKYEFEQATADIKLPVGFLKMPKSRQAAWLSENA